jgi:hypothetical protein
MIQVNALIPSLLAGNSVLLKPSPQTPLCSERILASLLAAGLPKDVCQVRSSSSSILSAGAYVWSLYRFFILRRRKWTLSSRTRSSRSSRSPDLSPTASESR